MPRKPKLNLSDKVHLVVRYAPMTCVELGLRLDASQQRVWRVAKQADDLLLFDGRVWYRPQFEESALPRC